MGERRFLTLLHQLTREVGLHIFLQPLCRSAFLADLCIIQSTWAGSLLLSSIASALSLLKSLSMTFS